MKAIICVLVAVVLICGGTGAYGQSVYFTDADGTGLWNNDDNWETACIDGNPGGVPQPANDATICTGKTCTMDISGEVETISTEGTGKLIIPSSFTLTLNEDEGVSTIDGSIELSGQIHIVIFDNIATTEWHQFAGSGDIIGKASTAKILIQTGGGAMVKCR